MLVKLSIIEGKVADEGWDKARAYHWDSKRENDWEQQVGFWAQR